MNDLSDDLCEGCCRGKQAKNPDYTGFLHLRNCTEYNPSVGHWRWGFRLSTSRRGLVPARLNERCD